MFIRMCVFSVKQRPCVRAGVCLSSGGWEDRTDDGEQRAEDGEIERERKTEVYLSTRALSFVSITINPR